MTQALLVVNWLMMMKSVIKIVRSVLNCDRLTGTYCLVWIAVQE